MHQVSEFAFHKIRDAINEEGLAIVPEVLNATVIEVLKKALALVNDPAAARSRGGVYAVRNLLEISEEIRDLCRTSRVRNLIEPILGKSCFPVRGILFDKISNANWKVPFHQDVTIAVKERFETTGFGPWSVKADVVHTQPPVSVLESMLSVRLHLDDCHEENGPLRVIPGSHRLGRISELAIDSVRQQLPERVCGVAVGGALLMRPLLLHASSPSQVAGHRRVVHIDFAASPLPKGLKWLSEPLADAPS